MRARGISYWERRLAAASAAADPDPFRPEVGAIGQWYVRHQIGDQWLLEQLSKMLQAGFVPTDVSSIVDRLHKVSANYPDQAVAVLSALLKSPRVERPPMIIQNFGFRGAQSNSRRSNRQFAQGFGQTAAALR